MNNKEYIDKIFDMAKLICVALGLFGGGFLAYIWAGRNFHAEQRLAITDTFLYLPLLILTIIYIPQYSKSVNKKRFLIIGVMTGIGIIIVRWAMHLSGVLHYPSEPLQTTSIFLTEASINIAITIGVNKYLHLKKTKG